MARRSDKQFIKKLEEDLEASWKNYHNMLAEAEKGTVNIHLIASLMERITNLEAEINRIKHVIADKQSKTMLFENAKANKEFFEYFSKIDFNEDGVYKKR